MTEPTTESPAAPEQEQTPAPDPLAEAKAEADKWKRLSRDNEKQAKANADAAKRLADIEAGNASELDKAVKAAREEGRVEVTQRANMRLVTAEARALAAEMQFRKPGHAVRLIDTADVKVNDDGEVDTAALKSLLEDLAKDDPLLLTVPDDGRPKGNADQGARVTPPPTDPRSADLAQIEADLKTNRRK